MAATPLKLGIIREGKLPPDSRVVLAPKLAAEVAAMPSIDLVIQPSAGRCFPDAAYTALGLKLQEDLSDRDVLIGVKEVPIEQLIAGKTYFFFSHTHKEQAYNRELLRAILAKKITLIDYERLTTDEGVRLIAFGRFAGMVGAHHALRAWGLRSGNYDLPQMNSFEDYEAAKAAYAKTDFGEVRIVSTGTGRVGKGAVEVLRDAGLTELTNVGFLAGKGKGAVFTKVGVKHYVQRKDGREFHKRDFFADPSEDYETAFVPFVKAADVMVHGIFWDNRAPAMFSLEDMQQEDFRIKVIADVTCDIYPVTSIPATRRASTIEDPYFGFDVRTEMLTEPFADGAITMMTVDNLPNEMPRDASNSFGMMFTQEILPELLKDESSILERATIARDGELTADYSYLENFVAGH